MEGGRGGDRRGIPPCTLPQLSSLGACHSRHSATLSTDWSKPRPHLNLPLFPLPSVLSFPHSVKGKEGVWLIQPYLAHPLPSLPRPPSSDSILIFFFVPAPSLPLLSLHPIHLHSPPPPPNRSETHYAIILHSTRIPQAQWDKRFAALHVYHSCGVGRAHNDKELGLRWNGCDVQTHFSAQFTMPDFPQRISLCNCIMQRVITAIMPNTVRTSCITPTIMDYAEVPRNSQAEFNHVLSMGYPFSHQWMYACRGRGSKHAPLSIPILMENSN